MQIKNMKFLVAVVNKNESFAVKNATRKKNYSMSNPRRPGGPQCLLGDAQNLTLFLISSTQTL